MDIVLSCNVSSLFCCSGGGCGGGGRCLVKFVLDCNVWLFGFSAAAAGSGGGGGGKMRPLSSSLSFGRRWFERLS